MKSANYTFLVHACVIFQFSCLKTNPSAEAKHWKNWNGPRYCGFKFKTKCQEFTNNVICRQRLFLPPALYYIMLPSKVHVNIILNWNFQIRIKIGRYMKVQFYVISLFNNDFNDFIASDITFLINPRIWKRLRQY